MDLQSTRMMLPNSDSYLQQIECAEYGHCSCLIFFFPTCLSTILWPMLDQSCKPLLCAGFSFASDWDETQPMEDAAFDMAMPLTAEEEKRVTALAADSPAEA